MQLIQEPGNTILFSQVSLFEIAIKQKIGKLPAFNATVEEVHEQAINDGFTFLPIHNQYLYYYNKVPLLETHRDPFDRLLIASAIVENAAIFSIDEKLCLYPDLIRVIW
ncbi:MAG: hypothetical protein JWP44_2503 [Mucilaginibacter sp.]|nr:hypothetical protein [Mucilaginibacter sp.]